MKHLIVAATILLLAACGGSTAPNNNPCANDMAAIRKLDGAPAMGTFNWSPTIQVWEYRANYSVKFDWTGGSCVETVLEGNGE